jgi:poly-gamma-glutamate synthesis protein (capsule biosynthesis protein)
MTPTVRLLAVGDLQLGDSATCVGFGFRSKVPSSDLLKCLQVFSTALGKSDLQFANLETPLSDAGLDQRARRSRQLRGIPDYAPVLRSAGFAVLNVANNHSLEHGQAAFLDSVTRLESLGIEVCGRRGLDGWAALPARLEVKGLRIGVLGYTLRPTPGVAERPHAEPDETQILRDVARLRGEVDCVLVSLHWGEEFVPLPSTEEVAFGHALIDAGATVILGHHPHVARPVERYGRGVIAYSLGNFAADMIWHEPLRLGLALDCDLSAEGVGRVEVHQARIDDSYLPRLNRTKSVSIASAGTVPALASGDYIGEARKTVQAQRRALYRYTLLNAWRFNPAVLLQLGLTTVRGKLAGLLGGQRDAVWG